MVCDVRPESDIKPIAPVGPHMADGARQFRLPTLQGLEVLTAIPGDIPVHDQRDLMERPSFSLAKTKRLAPIDYRVGDIWVRVETLKQ